MSRWGDEKTIKFIRLYRQYECLWNSKLSDYKNKTVRDQAYASVLEKMGDHNLTIKDVKNKIKGLRGTYQQELYKIKCSKSSGADEEDIYKPTLIWFKEMQFLNDVLECKDPLSIQMRSSVEVQQEPQPFLHISIEPLEQPPPSSQICTEALEQIGQSSEMSNESLEQPPSPDMQPYSKKRHLTSKRRSQPPYMRIVENSEESDDVTTATLQRLENITDAITNQRCIKDEFYYFGQNIAAQLRLLPLDIALNAQTKIQRLLFAVRLQANQ